jgi:hypothetical protein
MRHFASPAFWQAYLKLPENVRVLADKNYALLKENPQHPSLHFKKVGRFWSTRIGLRYAHWLSKRMAGYSGSGSARTPIMMLS